MSQDFDISTFKVTYFEECYELLQNGEEDLLTFKSNLSENQSVDPEALNSLFRSVHSIKGGAGAFSFTDIVNFTHGYETLLDKIRDQKIAISLALLDVLFEAQDMLVKLVNAAKTETEIPIEWQKMSDRLLKIAKGEEVLLNDLGEFEDAPVKTEEVKQLPHQWVTYQKTAKEEEEQGWGLYVTEEELNVLIAANRKIDLPIEEEPDEKIQDNFNDLPIDDKVSVDINPDEEVSVSEESDQILYGQTDTRTHFKITFIPDVHLLKFANEPMLLARELKTLGDFVAIIDLERMPSLDQMKSDEAYFSWEFHLKTDHTQDDVLEVFEFVIDDCRLIIEEMGLEDWPKTEKASQQIEEPKEEPQELVLSEPEPEKIDVLETSEKAADEGVKVESQPPIQDPVSEKPIFADPKPKQAPQEHTHTNTVQQKSEDVPNPELQRVSSIRVDLDRVDKLVNMVGELVITQAMLKEQSDALGTQNNQHINQRFDELNAHTRELQAGVMAIRMQPVKTVFSRMPRLVRELSAKLNKKVDLITSGEMTEVDKTVIEQLMDPLTHMVRNSIDHGIETPEVRIANNKPEKAKIQLSAEHRSGRIHIEISDDGAGINRELVYQKAIEKGLITGQENLQDQQIDELIFEPGFSTVTNVSDVSGRGAGMDVVSRNLTNLGGRVGVYSTPGHGATFVLSLPLTLAVLEGMIVRCGKENYIVPLSSVIENIHPTSDELKTLVTGKTVLYVNDEFIPLVTLYQLFNIPDAIKDPQDGLIVIVETEQYGQVGLVVDELIGQQQVVIKSLEDNYDPIAGVSAATILGTGKVSLILDVDGLAEMEHGAIRRKNYKKVTQHALITGGQVHGQSS